ncbi:unnamed protein product, partial [Ilex paraguariensis]
MGDEEADVMHMFIIQSWFKRKMLPLIDFMDYLVPIFAFLSFSPYSSNSVDEKFPEMKS